MAKLFKALYDFTAEQPDELDVSAGDLIECEKVTAGEWGIGKSRTTGKTGVFPWNYVEVVKATAPPPVASRAQKPSATGKVHYINVAKSGILGNSGAGGAGGAIGMPQMYDTQSGATSGGSGGPLPDLEGNAWYAGAIERAQAINFIEPYQDGSFLIRKSQSHHGFTLSVKFLDLCRHIKILCVNGKYGFSEPTEYASVQDMVAHFQKTSLQCYNAELETTLKYPYSSAPKETADSRRDDFDEDLYMSNKDELIKTLQKHSGMYAHKGKGGMAWDATMYSEAVQKLKTEATCQEQVLALLKNQKKLLDSSMSRLQRETDRSAANANLGIIKKKIIDAQRNLEKTNTTLATQRRRDEESGGDRRDTRAGASGVGPAGRGLGFVQGKILAVPDPTTSKFYVGLIPREDAEAQLKPRKDGTYLIRKSTRDQDPYTLSLRYNGKTKHIQIKYDGMRFGLAEPLAFYTLESLCEYYKSETLSDTIRTELKESIK